MKWYRDSSDKIREHPVFGLVILASVVVVTLYKTTDWLHRAGGELSRLLGKGFVSDKTGAIVPMDSLSWVLLAIILLIVVGILALIQCFLTNQKLARAVRDAELKTENESKGLEETFEKMMQAASQIGGQLFPRDRLPQKNLLRVRHTYLVDENFDTFVTREDDYKAISDLPIERIVIGAEAAAEPCRLLKDISFKVRDNDALNQVVYLPARNDPFRKEVLLFFLPHIRPDEPTPRQIVVTFRWPKMFRQLQTRGFEIGEWTIKSRDPVPEAEMRVFFAPSLKRQIRASIHGQRLLPADESLDPAVCDSPGKGDWEGWSYKLRNVSTGKYLVKFEMN